MSDLTPAQAEVLAVVAAHEGPLTAANVQERVDGLNLSGTLFVLNRLEAMALVVSFRRQGESLAQFVVTQQGREAAGVA